MAYRSRRCSSVPAGSHAPATPPLMPYVRDERYGTRSRVPYLPHAPQPPLVCPAIRLLSHTRTSAPACRRSAKRRCGAGAGLYSLVWAVKYCVHVCPCMQSLGTLCTTCVYSCPCARARRSAPACCWRSSAPPPARRRRRRRRCCWRCATAPPYF